MNIGDFLFNILFLGAFNVLYYKYATKRTVLSTLSDPHVLINIISIPVMNNLLGLHVLITAVILIVLHVLCYLIRKL